MWGVWVVWCVVAPLAETERCSIATSHDIVNGTVHPGSTCEPNCTCTICGCFSARTRARHLSLSCANCCNSRYEFVFGASIRRSPGSGVLNISNTACLINRVLSSPVSLKMWLSHCRRLALIQLTMLNVFYFAVASWCGVLPEITLTIRAFAPFRAAITSPVST